MNGLRAVALDPEGRHLYVTGWLGEGASSLGAIAILEPGASGDLRLIEVVSGADPGIPGLVEFRAPTFSRDGRHLYLLAASTPGSAVAVFERDLASGKLRFVESEHEGIGIHGGTGSGLRLSADGDHLYFASLNGRKVVWYGRDAQTGSLSFGGEVKRGDPGIEGLYGPGSVDVTPDGRQVLVASRFDSSLTVFDRDRATGDLSFVTTYFGGTGGLGRISSPRRVAISPDGEAVYLVNDPGGPQFDYHGSVSVFRRDVATGVLTVVVPAIDPATGIDSLNAATAMAVDPFGDFVLTAARDDHAVSTLR